VGERAVGWLIVAAIAVSVAMAVVGSVPDIPWSLRRMMGRLQFGIGLVFAFEYVVRVWVAPEMRRFRGSVAPRLRYVVTPMALIDLWTVVAMLLPALSDAWTLLRLARVLLLVAVLRFGRYSVALRTFAMVFRHRRVELAAYLLVVLVLLVLSSGLMYALEGQVQPGRFGTLPETLWWSVITLTTIGYGDSSPVTPVGRLVGGFIALLGLGVVTIPAGILASGFQEAYRERRAARLRPLTGAPRCPHCGQALPDGRGGP
jgi:voltage-gated potassium channel